jgi:hypothetical protein
MSSLGLLLSSSNFPIFFLRQSFLFDLLEKVIVSDFKYLFTYFIKSNLPFLKVNFELTLPFLNDLSKFRNKVLILLYYFIFELLVGFSPLVVPIIKDDLQDCYNKTGKKISKQKVKSNSLVSSRKIDKFIFYRDLRLSQSSVFLTFISCFLSRHNYLNYTVPSKLLKISVSKNSCQFLLNPGLSSLDFFSQFDDFILSRVLLSFSFSRKNFLLLNKFDYFLASLGLNLFKVNEIVVNNNKFLIDSNERTQDCFYCNNKLFLIPSSI